VAETIILSAGVLANYLLKSPNPWLQTAAALLGVISYDTIGSCNTDPPAKPTFSDAEVSAILNLTLGGDFVSGVGKLKDLLLNTLWYQFCHCDAGAQPVPPPVEPPPASISIPGPTSNCGTLATHPFSWNDLNWHWMVGAGTTAGVDNAWDALPSGCTALRMTVNESTTDPVTNAITMTQRFRSASNTALTANNRGIYDGGFSPAGTGKVFTFPVPAGAVRWAVGVISASSPSIAHTLNFSVEFLCGTTTGDTPAAPCCPPDPILAAMVQQIWEQVNLIQRQAVPFAYVPGTAHAGLSGNGTIGISGLLGAKVDVTTLPPSYGRAAALPVEYFGLGFITFGTPDGYPTSYKLEHDPQLMLPSRCSAYTDLAYDLAPGVVATITELVREP
jgi:hypothetical protein